MKRFWLGLGLLGLLLGLGIWEQTQIPALTEPIAEQLDAAAQAAFLEDWEKAAACAGVAQQKWQKCWDLLAITTHHGPMEEIDGLLAQAEALLRAREESKFSAYCARLAELIRALGEAHRVNLRNLLAHPLPGQ